jgi:hypothetical protein
VNFCLQASLPFLNAKRSVYRLREVLQALVNLDNSKVNLNVRIKKILFHNELYKFELAFHCHLNHLNPIFEHKVMVKTLKRVQNLNLNPI